MNKALMISMQPQHAKNILNGKKTLELRTWIPKDYVGWVYVYVTKGKPYLVKFYNDYPIQAINDYTYQELLDDGNVPMNGKVAFRFWFDEYDTLTYEDFWDRHDYIANDGEVGWEVDSDYIKLFCLDYQDILDYGFREKPHRHQVDLYAWRIKDLEIFDTPKQLSDFIVGLNCLGDIIPPTYKKLTKAPQKMQWVYAKELENEKTK